MNSEMPHRFKLGNHIVRVVHKEDGSIKLIIPTTAKDDGSIFWVQALDDMPLLMGWALEKAEEEQVK